MNFMKEVNEFKESRIKNWIRKKGYEPTIKKTIALFRRHGVKEYVQRISDTRWHYICKTKRGEIIYNVTHYIESVIKGGINHDKTTKEHQG